MDKYNKTAKICNDMQNDLRVLTRLWALLAKVLTLISCGALIMYIKCLIYADHLYFVLIIDYFMLNKIDQLQCKN